MVEYRRAAAALSGEDDEGEGWLGGWGLGLGPAVRVLPFVVEEEGHERCVVVSVSYPSSTYHRSVHNIHMHIHMHTASSPSRPCSTWGSTPSARASSCPSTQPNSVRPEFCFFILHAPVCSQSFCTVARSELTN